MTTKTTASPTKATMKTSDLTVAVVDSGQFVEFALRLSRGFGRVLYCADLRCAYPRVQDMVIGDNLPGIERISDPWSAKDVDVWAFPDCSHPELQAELRRQGYPVWGSGDGSRLEWNRVQFRRELAKLGLPVRDYTVLHGLANLSAYLADRPDQYIRISRFRGNGETWHWVNADASACKLDELAVEYGPIQDEIDFLVESGYDAVEVGYDGYFAGGRFPNMAFHGLEAKDKGYLGAAVSYDDLPEALRDTNDKMAPLLARYGYANFYSSEVRIAEDALPYLEDPTCRHASPAGEPLLEVLGNLPEIVWEGANGVCLDPVIEAKFAAQAMIEFKGEYKPDRNPLTRWRTLEVPDNVRRWIKLYNVTRTGETTYAFPPVAHSDITVGSVLGVGNTVEEAVSALKDHAAFADGQPVTVEVEALAGAIADMADSEAVSLPAGQSLPEPAIVLSDA